MDLGRPLILFFTILTLSACGVKPYEVTRFHAISPPQGESIEVRSANPSLQNSLEFSRYADLLGNSLSRAGYQPPQGQSSLYIAELGYEEQAITEIYDDSPQSSVGVGVGGGSRSGTNVGVGLSLGFGSSENSAKKLHIVTLDIYRRHDAIRVYEGRVTHESKAALPEAMPSMIEALFTNFPGESGKTDKIKVD